jgi:hypothetical protein
MIEKITNKVSNVAKRCTSFIKRCGMAIAMFFGATFGASRRRS